MSKETTLKDELLGLGSIVEVDDMDAYPDMKYVIIARAIGKNSGGTTILRYRVAPHPEGITSTNEDEVLTVEGSKITTVYQAGYMDAEDEAFLAHHLQSLGEQPPIKVKPKQDTTASTKVTTTAATATNAPAVTTSEPLEAKDERKERALLQADPFYKLRKK